MTNNEIIKALPFLAKYCKDEYNGISVDEVLLGAFDLIYRQKAEIERLEAELDDLKRDDLPRCKDALCRANEIGMAVDKENQELKADVQRLMKENARVTENAVKLIVAQSTARSEAIKECTDKIKAKFDKHGVDYTAYAIVDDVAKELVGNDNKSPIVDNQN